MCAAVGNLGRIPPGMVEAIYGRLERDGDKAARLTAPMLAAAFRWRPHMVARAVEAMTSLGVLVDGVIASEWRPNRTRDAKPADASENRTLGADNSDAGPPSRALSEHPSSVRSRRHYWLHKAKTGAASGSEQPVRSDAASLSSFPSDRLKEQKQTTARAEPDGFAELRAVWPRPERMAQAQREYRKAVQKIAPADLIALARRYAEADRPVKFCRYLVHWLHDEEWRDQQPLPLASAPREVASTDPPKPKIDWIALGEAWVTTRQWPPDVGPPPDKDTCLMPFGWMQRFRRALIDRHSGERVSA